MAMFEVGWNSEDSLLRVRFLGPLLVCLLVIDAIAEPQTGQALTSVQVPVAND